jgi:FtsZ-binding cell division protein ZapB
MMIVYGVSLNIVFVQSDSMLAIKRTLNQKIALLLFSLLGTLAGLLGTFGSIMLAVEKRSEKIKEMISRNKMIQQATERIKMLNNAFGDSKERRRSMKMEANHNLHGSLESLRENSKLNNADSNRHTHYHVNGFI